MSLSLCVSVCVSNHHPSKQVLPSGSIGEVCIKGPSVTPGYVNNDEANRTGFLGGWFHTGDQGV